MRVQICGLWLGLCSVYAFATNDEGIDWKNIKRPSREQPIHESALSDPELEARHPNDNHPRNRPIPITVTRYTLRLSANPETGLLNGISTIFFKSRTENLDTLTVDAYDMQIAGVKIGNEETPFVYDGQTVQVFLHKALTFGESSVVQIRYTAKRSQSFFLARPDAVNPRRMLGAYTFTQPEESRKWFPCIDRPFAKAPFELQLSVPNGYKALSNGTLISAHEVDGKNEWHYQSSQAIAPYLVSLAIGRYEVHKIGEFKGKPLTLWSPPAITAAALRDTARTKAMMESISRFTGLDYPFPAYTQSIADAWEVSMEHQTASTLGAWVITGDGLDEATVVHELAHQWFGDWVTPETWSDLWLSEGFATYLPYVFFEENAAHNKALGEIDEWREGYFTEAKKSAHALSPVIPDIDSMFDAHAYEKGALVVKFMRYLTNRSTASGQEDKFRTAVQLYLNSHAQKTVRHVDLQKALETVTDQSWQVFFDQWVRSPGHPELSVAFENKPDEVILKITQAQSLDEKREWPTFQFPIEVELFAKDGRSVRKVIEIYNSIQEFHIRPGFQVVGLDFDPDWEVPAEVDIQENLAGHLTVFTYARSERSRLDAMRAIFAEQDLLASEDFARLLILDKSLYLKADALDKLTKKPANRPIVERLLIDLRSRDKEWDRTIRTAVAAAQAWLVKTRGTPLTPQEEAALQEEFRHGPLTVGERKAILEKLSSLSLPRTQTFAMERLQESFWSMRDRGQLIDLLVKNPTDTSLPFILNALQSTGIYWFRNIAMSLVTAEYDKKELVPILLARAKSASVLSTRKYAIDLLGVQKSSKDSVCNELTEFAKAREQKPDRLDEIRLAAKNAMENLDCPAADDEVSQAPHPKRSKDSQS